MNGIIGKKIGMTRVFDAQGHQVPVTVIEAGPCRVVQAKTEKTDGYNAVQIGFMEQKPRRVSKAVAAHCAKAQLPPFRVLREIRVDASENLEPGATVTVSMFDGVPFVDVVATTKGRGFQGVVRRHGFTGGRKTHGSGNHRRTGSIGMKTWPSRVFKNKRMPGHMGVNRVTTQNLKVIQVRPEDNVLLVRGAVPGATGSLVMVYKGLKKKAVPSS